MCARVSEDPEGRERRWTTTTHVTCALEGGCQAREAASRSKLEDSLALALAAAVWAMEERRGVQFEEAGHGDGGRVEDVACCVRGGRVGSGDVQLARGRERGRRTPQRMARHEAHLDVVGSDLGAYSAVAPALVGADGWGRGRWAKVCWFLSWWQSL